MLKKIIKTVILLIVSAPLVAVIWLEVFLIPNLLVDALAGWGKVGLYAPVLHLASILVIVAATGFTAWRAGREGILETHRLLVDSSLSPVVNTIEKVVNGKWSADTHLQGQALNIGAKVGMVAGQVKAGEVDKDQVLTAIESMTVPAAKRQVGAGIDVVEDMADFMLERKKARLS